jgi:uncharacterized protein (TIGR02452 family)
VDLRDVAADTLEIIDRRAYTTRGGAAVDLGAAIDAAVRGTTLFTPEDLDALAKAPRPAGGRRPRVEVTDETTAAAARRLVQAEGTADVAMLNFASAKRPGGGWLSGARAQEEDLARCSALYRCLLAQPRYYEANLAHPSLLYTDHVIHAPRVPFFRDDRHALLDEPYLASVITAPAPNAGEVLRREPDAAPQVRATLAARAGKVLAVAAHRGHHTLVLGAWGCGVFRNDPTHVAGVFADLLDGPGFAGAFDRVVFAVYDRSAGRTTLRAFQDRLGRWAARR